MSENNLPKTLVFNPAHIKAASRYKTFSAEGFVQVAVVDAVNKNSSDKVYENGQVVEGKKKPSYLQIQLELSPLKVPGEFKSLDHSIKLKQYLTLPILAPNSIEPNSADEEATGGDMITRLAKTLRYFVGAEEIPAFPKKQSNGKYLFDGQEIDVKEVDSAKEYMNQKATEVANKFWSQPDRWKTPKRMAYAKIKQEVGNDGVKRPTIQFLTDRLPEGAELLTVNEWYKTTSTED